VDTHTHTNTHSYKHTHTNTQTQTHKNTHTHKHPNTHTHGKTWDRQFAYRSHLGQAARLAWTAAAVQARLAAEARHPCLARARPPAQPPARPTAAGSPGASAEAAAVGAPAAAAGAAAAAAATQTAAAAQLVDPGFARRKLSAPAGTRTVPARAPVPAAAAPAAAPPAAGKAVDLEHMHTPVTLKACHSQCALLHTGQLRSGKPGSRAAGHGASLMNPMKIVVLTQQPHHRPVFKPGGRGGGRTTRGVLALQQVGITRDLDHAPSRLRRCPAPFYARQC